MKFKKSRMTVSLRHASQSRHKAMKSIYEAIVELAANCGDSYNRLFLNKKRQLQYGDILIEYYRSKSKAYLKVYDKANGMSYEKLIKSFSAYRERESSKGDRGFMGKGAKDTTALGDLKAETINGDDYSVLFLKENWNIEHGTEKVKAKNRKEMKIKRGNGTLMTLFINPDSKIQLPQIDNLLKYLPHHFAMNSLINEKSEGARVNLFDVNSKKMHSLVYREPDNLETAVNMKFNVPGYPDANAKFILKKSSKPLPEYNRPFNQHGILIKSGTACHERSFLDNKYKDEQLLSNYLGTLECDYINQLAEEFDEATSKNKNISDKNPQLIIDENRIDGLDRAHPFTKALFQKPLLEIKKILDAERAKFKESKDIGSKETDKALKKAEKIFDDFLKEESDIDDSLKGGDQDKLNKKGIILFPPYLKLQVGEEKRVSLYVNKNKLNAGHDYILLKMSNFSDCVEFEKDKIKLIPSKKDENIMRTSFTVKGLKPMKNGEIKIWGKSSELVNLPIKEVYENLIREFKKDLEFEHKNYSVKFNKKKVLKVFAKYPDFIDADTESKITNSDHQNVAHLGRSNPVFKTKKGSNFAVAEIVVEGRRLHSNSKITIELNELNDTCDVSVVDKEQSKGIKIKIVKEAFGKYRAIWDRDKPYILKIGALHPQLKQILGEPNSAGHYPGEETPQFKILLCEILAERLAWKKIELSTRKEPGLYTEWRDEKDVRNIGDGVIATYLGHRNDAILKLFNSLLAKSDLSTEKNRKNSNIINFNN